MVSPDQISRMMQDSKAGATNLTCPQCDTPVDFLDIQRNDLQDIRPDRLFPCPHCPTQFWPENGFLYQLYENIGEQAYFGLPLPLGGVTTGNFTDVQVGHSKEYGQHNIDRGYHIETITLQSAKLADSDEELTPQSLDGAFTRATLGDCVLLTIAPTDSVSVAINATLRDGAEEDTPVSTGDQIDIQYRYVKAPSAAKNPPWIDLLREAENVIRRKNTLAMYPLVVSSMDNFLVRQMVLYYRWQGHTHDESEATLNAYGGRHGPNRYQIVENVFSDTHDEELPDSCYDEEWEWFREMNQTRNGIVHPDADPMESVPRDEAIECFNKTLDLMVKIFDFIWFDAEHGESTASEDLDTNHRS
jgi:hypothetical protein